MRITGGKYCGRKISCPPGEIRPAMDRMRESVFAVLGDLTGMSFLDLFAGSGIIGIEAASRGASPVFLVEQDRGKIATLKKNIVFIESEIKIKLSRVESFVAKTNQVFDYIFIDPPFRYPNKEKILWQIKDSLIFSGKGFVLLHLPRQERNSFVLPFFELQDERRYGGSLVLFYKMA